MKEGRKWTQTPARTLCSNSGKQEQPALGGSDEDGTKGADDRYGDTEHKIC